MSCIFNKLQNFSVKFKTKNNIPQGLFTADNLNNFYPNNSLKDLATSEELLKSYCNTRLSNVHSIFEYVFVTEAQITNVIQKLKSTAGRYDHITLDMLKYSLHMTVSNIT